MFLCLDFSFYPLSWIINRNVGVVLFRFKSLGGHREIEFFPKASRSQTDGYSFTAALH